MLRRGRVFDLRNISDVSRTFILSSQRGTVSHLHNTDCFTLKDARTAVSHVEPRLFDLHFRQELGNIPMSDTTNILSHKAQTVLDRKRLGQLCDELGSSIFTFDKDVVRDGVTDAGDFIRVISCPGCVTQYDIEDGDNSVDGKLMCMNYLHGPS